MTARSVKLHEIANARSGDKGNRLNIALVCRDPAHYADDRAAGHRRTRRAGVRRAQAVAGCALRPAEARRVQLRA